MTEPNCQSFENSSVPQGDPAPAVSNAPAQRKKPHIAVRVLMQLLSFCLFIVLLVSLLAATVVTDLHALTSAGGIDKIISSIFSPASAPISPRPLLGAAGVWYTPALPEDDYTLPTGMEDVDLSGILSGSDISVEDLANGDLSELIDAVIEQIEAETGEDLPFTAEQVTTVIQESTISDYLSEKAASYADDILNGTENTVITTEEIVGLLEENQALLEQELDIQITPEFKEVFTQKVDEVVVQGDLNTVIRDTVNEAVDTAIQEATGGMDTTAVREAMAFLASDTLLYACIGICIALLLLLCLANWYNVPAGLTWAGMAAAISGGLLSLPIMLIRSMPELIEALTVGITPIANLIHSFAGLLARVHYAVFFIGVGLIVLSIVWRILRTSARKKNAASLD